MRCCSLGMCSCAATVFLPTETAQAQPGNAEMDALKGKLDFVQKRFAKLVEILNENLDEPARKKVWESLGRDHARDYRSLTDRYKGNLRGFLDDIQKQWVEKAEYDEQAGTIRITDKSPVCTCPLVKQGLTPQDFCNCTLGWQKEAYSAVVGRPVGVVLEESILRGGKKCVFRIQIL